MDSRLPAGTGPPTDRPSLRSPITRARVEALSFLQDVALLATSARTWDELMRTIIERTTAAVDAEVCSVYLVDRDASGVTLAATNGLEASQVGSARLPMGVGITGRVAASGRRIVSINVRRDRRFAWLQGLDEPRLTSMCSVPLRWNDRVVGVLNVQTVERRTFSQADIRFLESLAALLAGIVEKGRLQKEAEAQVASLSAIDETRARLVTIVTHDLRTPLAIFRGCVELIGLAAQEAGATGARKWELEALRQVDRLDTMIDSTLAGLRVLGQEPPTLQLMDVAESVDRTAAEVAPILRRHRLEVSFAERPLNAVGSPEVLGRVLEYLLENASKYAPAGGRITIAGGRDGPLVRLAISDDGPGVPVEWREQVFEPFVRREDSSRGSGIGLFAARHMARSMAGELRLEAIDSGGSRFVLELPAAHGPGERRARGRRAGRQANAGASSGI